MLQERSPKFIIHPVFFIKPDKTNLFPEEHPP